MRVENEEIVKSIQSRDCRLSSQITTSSHYIVCYFDILIYLFIYAQYAILNLIKDNILYYYINLYIMIQLHTFLSVDLREVQVLFLLIILLNRTNYPFAIHIFFYIHFYGVV